MAQKKTIEIDVGAMRVRGEERRSIDTSTGANRTPIEMATPARPSTVQKAMLTRPMSAIESNGSVARPTNAV
jgi:hypothetical protein